MSRHTGASYRHVSDHKNTPPVSYPRGCVQKTMPNSNETAGISAPLLYHPARKLSSGKDR